MIMLKKGGEIAVIHRTYKRGTTQNVTNVESVFIDRYLSIDTTSLEVLIFISDDIYYRIILLSGIKPEDFVNAMLKQSIRQDKIEQVLS